MPARGTRKQRGRLVTADDIADRLRISQSTVSRAFTPNASVSPDLRKRIIEVANEIGYRPNAIARSLIVRRSNIFGIVLANLSNPFYSEVLELFSRRLQQLGKQLLLSKIPADADVADAVPILMQYQADAIIVASASISRTAGRHWAKHKYPVLLFNRHVAGIALPAICSDHRADGRHVAHFLIDRGFRRIAFAAGTTDSFTSAEREQGLLAGMSERKLELVGRASGEDYTYQAGMAATQALTPTQPDVIVFANSLMALGGIDYIRFTLGMRVPQDISVVGFDDIAMCAWPSYDLTTVRSALPDMIERTVSAIETISAGKKLPSKPILVAGTLIERSSTGRRT